MSKRRTYQLLALALALMTLGTTVFALLYVTRQIDMQATVKVTGNIRVYEDANMTTEITTYDWGEFDPSINEQKEKNLWIKNTGNAKVYVRWYVTFVTSLNVTWNDTSDRYDLLRNGITLIWKFFLETQSGIPHYKATDDPSPTVWVLNPDESFDCRMGMQIQQGAWSSEDLSAFSIYFKAEDA